MNDCNIRAFWICILILCHSMFLLISLSVWRALFNISCRIDLVEIYSLSFCLPGIVFLFPFVKDSFVAYSILDSIFVLQYCDNLMSLSWLIKFLLWNLLLGKLGRPVYCFFFLTDLRIFSIFLTAWLYLGIDLVELNLVIFDLYICILL